jgi:uncharacterized protein (TIGR02444 family)
VDESKQTAVEEAFWQFSLAFYERPGVAEALTALQDREGIDVNLALFAVWIGLSGRDMFSGDLLAIAESKAAALRKEIVIPLRELRRRLRHHSDADVQRLREGVKALELSGEKLVQRRLARLAGSENANISHEVRLANARSNLALYLGVDVVRSREAAVLFESVDAYAGTG